MVADNQSGRLVVAVLGYSRRRDSALNPVCAERLEYAQRRADGARAVVLSGWARRRKAIPESELMREAWAGPNVPLVCDPDAGSTAANAANVAAAAEALGADELLVVTSSWHRRRARLLLRAAVRDRGLRLVVEGAPGGWHPLVLAREVACYLLLPLQFPRARRRESR